MIRLRIVEQTQGGELGGPPGGLGQPKAGELRDCCGGVLTPVQKQGEDVMRRVTGLEVEVDAGAGHTVLSAGIHQI